MENNSSTVTLKLIGDADEEADMVCEKDELIKESAYFRVMFNGDFVERNQNVIELKVIRICLYLYIFCLTVLSK